MVKILEEEGSENMMNKYKVYLFIYYLIHPNRKGWHQKASSLLVSICLPSPGEIPTH